MENAEFKVHILNEQGIEKAIKIRNVFDVALNSLLHLCTPGRELSIAKTKLEEACFFAKKSMASQEINQES